MTMYPTFTITPNVTPKKLYAIPLVGILIKILIVIPVAIEVAVLSLAANILVTLNSFVVLFQGKYWNPAYNLLLGTMKLSAKTYMFITGLTDKYPGFDLSIDPSFGITFEIVKPEKPNRFFAIPILGGLARLIIMIPYFIYQNVLQNGSAVAMVSSFAKVLVAGKYPESTYEFIRDTQRVTLASVFYMAGVSDNYPSFSISWNHKTIKIALIIAGVLLMFMNMTSQLASSFTSPRNQYTQPYSGQYNSNTYR